MFGRLVVVALLVLTIATGGFFHAIIPHSHGHTHTAGGVDATWQSLHTALRDEEKKVIFSALSAFTLLVVAVLTVRTVFGFITAIPGYIPTGCSPNVFEALRRGNVPYRKFT